MNILVHQVRLVLTAVQYFTRLPVPAWVGYSDRQLNDASRYFPLVGVVVGLATGLIYLATLRLFPHSVAVLLSMLAGVWLTGGFHEDGLADTCDGFGGGRDKAQILHIMKDSRLGSYGVLGLVFALLFKFSVLTELPASAFLAVSVAAHAISRLMAVSVIHTQHYVRDDASARAGAASQSLTVSGLIIATGIAIAPLLWVGGAALAGAAFALALRVVMGRYFLYRIGGFTGDCLGAIQQISEIGFYLGVLAWILF